MEQRFQFRMPPPPELAFLKRWKWFGFLAWGFPCAVLPLFQFISHSPPLLWWPFVLVTGCALTARIRLNDIRRRESQARFGFIEITPEELRIGSSFKTVRSYYWRDFRGCEVRNGNIHIRFLQEGVVRLSELEDPDALIDALRAQTPSRR